MSVHLGGKQRRTYLIPERMYVLKNIELLQCKLNEFFFFTCFSLMQTEKYNLHLLLLLVSSILISLTYMHFALLRFIILSLLVLLEK